MGTPIFPPPGYRGRDESRSGERAKRLGDPSILPRIALLINSSKIRKTAELSAGTEHRPH